jgi:hypothetical protein
LIRNGFLWISLRRYARIVVHRGSARPPFVSTAIGRGNLLLRRVWWWRLRAQTPGSLLPLHLRLPCDEAFASQARSQVLLLQWVPQGHRLLQQCAQQQARWPRHCRYLHNKRRCRRGRGALRTPNQSKRSRKHASSARACAPACRKCCCRRWLNHRRPTKQSQPWKMCRSSLTKPAASFTCERGWEETGVRRGSSGR